MACTSATLSTSNRENVNASRGPLWYCPMPIQPYDFGKNSAMPVHDEAAGDAALRLAPFEALAGLLLLVRVRIDLRPNLTPVALASARPRAVRSRMRRRSSLAATPRCPEGAPTRHTTLQCVC